MNKESIMESAKQGDVSRQFLLGGCYYSENDFQSATKWFTKAAEQNHLEAQYILGMLYLSKLQDFEKAIHWLSRASLFGHTGATEELEQLIALSNES
jgi:hypothetical protein